MLTLISPAKKLLSISKPYSGAVTQPYFTAQTKDLVHIMKTKSMADLARLMDLSADLAKLNYDRYQSYSLNQAPVNTSYPALLLFQGDVYQGLQAKSWSQEDIDYAQSHLGILSGLYGLLKPKDLIQPYRLEMGVRLENPKGHTLYDFWKDKITSYLNEQLFSHKNPLLINLASKEYFKAVDEKKLNHPVLTVNFYEQKNNEVKMIGIYAKKARGMMAKYLIQNRVDQVEQMKQFNESSYCFNESLSTPQQLAFVRVH